MALVGLIVAGAVLLGWCAGGRLARLAALPVRDRWLVLLAFGVQLTGATVGVGGGGADALAYATGLFVSALLTLAFLVRNRRVAGLPLVAAGLLLNGVVVAANGAMPVSVAAAARAGIDTAAINAGADPRHAVAGPGSVLSPFGDTVPLQLPAHPEVVSPGDVLIAAGFGLFVVAGMRRPRPARLSARPRRARVRPADSG